MAIKWIGTILILGSCGGFGLSLAASQVREEAALRQLVGMLDYMECELQYRLTPLPDLCRQAAENFQGAVSQAMLVFSRQLEAQVAPDPAFCMAAVLSQKGNLPGRAHNALSLLGQTLGRFDLTGQLKGMEAVRTECRRQLELLSENRDARLRSYKTLGICAGAAITILFI